MAASSGRGAMTRICCEYSGIRPGKDIFVERSAHERSGLYPLETLTVFLRLCLRARMTTHVVLLIPQPAS